MKSSQTFKPTICPVCSKIKTQFFVIGYKTLNCTDCARDLAQNWRCDDELRDVALALIRCARGLLRRDLLRVDLEREFLLLFAFRGKIRVASGGEGQE